MMRGCTCYASIFFGGGAFTDIVCSDVSSFCRLSITQSHVALKGIFRMSAVTILHRERRLWSAWAPLENQELATVPAHFNGVNFAQIPKFG